MDIAQNDPRPHHYRFAHLVLPGLARDRGPHLVDGDPDRDVAAELAALWDDFGKQLPDAERLPSDGLRGSRITLGAHRLLVVVLPRPAAPAEAYYTAVVQPEGTGHCRYFTMEHAVNPFTGEPYTVLGEWADGSHLNLGSAEPGLSAFLAAVVTVLDESEPGDATGRPGPAGKPQKPERRGLRGLFGR
ncbi:hypothetical protein [Kitasatospora sp. NPDC059599]|uniref:hypothetical protein n=1 Tax=Kitasatospora sp. NPDC059599 TaxID=3346880 RepID=UPI00367DF04C